MERAGGGGGVGPGSVSFFDRQPGRPQGDTSAAAASADDELLPSGNAGLGSLHDAYNKLAVALTKKVSYASRELRGALPTRFSVGSFQ